MQHEKCLGSDVTAVKKTLKNLSSPKGESGLTTSTACCNVISFTPTTASIISWLYSAVLLVFSLCYSGSARWSSTAHCRCRRTGSDTSSSTSSR